MKLGFYSTSTHFFAKEYFTAGNKFFQSSGELVMHTSFTGKFMQKKVLQTQLAFNMGGS